MAGKNRAPLLTGRALRAAVRGFCEVEYERVTYEPWDPSRYPDLAEMEKSLDERKDVERMCTEAEKVLGQLRKKRGPLRQWANGALLALAEIRPEKPAATLHAFMVEMFERSSVPAGVPVDRRQKNAKQAPPSIVWPSGPKRKPTPRELAFMTLLLGHWPDLPVNTPISPEEVIRQEARAIASLRRRRAPPG
jgi:hypothetical protein